MTVLVVSKVLGDKGYDGYGGYVYMVETTILVINFEIFLWWFVLKFGDFRAFRIKFGDSGW